MARLIHPKGNGKGSRLGMFRLVVECCLQDLKHFPAISFPESAHEGIENQPVKQNPARIWIMLSLLRPVLSQNSFCDFFISQIKQQHARALGK